MALSKAVLKGRIVTEIQTVSAAQGIAILSTAQLEKFAEALANAIVDEIKDNAIVNGTVTGGGSSAGQAVQGTIT